MDHSEALNKQEKRAAVGLAGIYGLRMLGMFLILPVFALYAAHIPGGDNHFLVGLALGTYGLTQALLQLPYGMISDRIGRKKVIVFGLLLFAAGSFIAAFATNIYWIIFGRMVQGSGAIAAALTALLADLTREEHRTKAMAMIGGTIGMTFALSLVAGPLIAHFIGVPGIFALTGILSLAAILAIKYYVPDPQHTSFHSDAEANPAKLRDVVRDGQLLRLDFGIFALHAAQMGMFVVIPAILERTGHLPLKHHWWVYLPVVIVAFILMVPAIIYGEKRGKLKNVFVGAIFIMVMAQLGMFLGNHDFVAVVTSLLLYFVAFNILEASLPSLISKLAPVSAKGTAMGVYNTSQAFGQFTGGAIGGLLAQHYGFAEVFAFCTALMVIWLAVAVGMRTPPAVKTRMFHLGKLSGGDADRLKQALAGVMGVEEVIVLAEEGVAMLKVKLSGWDEAGAMKLIQGET